MSGQIAEEVRGGDHVLQSLAQAQVAGIHYQELAVDAVPPAEQVFVAEPPVVPYSPARCSRDGSSRYQSSWGCRRFAARDTPDCVRQSRMSAGRGRPHGPRRGKRGTAVAARSARRAVPQLAQGNADVGMNVLEVAAQLRTTDGAGTSRSGTARADRFPRPPRRGVLSTRPPRRRRSGNSSNSPSGRACFGVPGTPGLGETGMPDAMDADAVADLHTPPPEQGTGRVRVGWPAMTMASQRGAPSTLGRGGQVLRTTPARAGPFPPQRRASRSGSKNRTFFISAGRPVGHPVLRVAGRRAIMRCPTTRATWRSGRQATAGHPVLRVTPRSGHPVLRVGGGGLGYPELRVAAPRGTRYSGSRPAGVLPRWPQWPFPRNPSAQVEGLDQVLYEEDGLGAGITVVFPGDFQGADAMAGHKRAVSLPTDWPIPSGWGVPRTLGLLKKPFSRRTKTCGIAVTAR